MAEAEKVCPRCERAFARDIAFCPYDGSRLLGDEESDSLVGRDIDGRFTVSALLGKGGMGAVYLATQHPMEREVALKVLKPEVSKTVEVKKRFLREAKASSRLTNPHTVSVIDFGQTDDGMLYLAMERLIGETLGDLLKKGPLTEQRAQGLVMQLCESLAEAHAQGLVHRDVKPENIFLLNPGTSREFVKVLDFGIAKSVANADETALTRTGMVCGTPEYMSPEHASGKGATPASDVYSVGVLLYQALAGATPFSSSESPMQVLIRHIQEPPPPLRERMEGRPLSVPMEALIERCLAKDPAARPADAEALLGELAALDDARASAHRAATVEHASGARLPRPSDDRPTVATPAPDPSDVASATPEPLPRAVGVTDDLLRAARPSRWPWVLGLGALALAALLAAWHFAGRDQPPVTAEPRQATLSAVALPTAPASGAPPSTSAAPVTPAPTPAPLVLPPPPAPPTVATPTPTPTHAPSKEVAKPTVSPSGSARKSTPGTPPAVVRLRAVVVNSEPAGAAVLVDGEPRGVTPAEFTARVGAHVLVRKAGYRERELVLEAGGSSRLKVVLEPTDESAIRKALEDGLK